MTWTFGGTAIHIKEKKYCPGTTFTSRKLIIWVLRQKKDKWVTQNHPFYTLIKYIWGYEQVWTFAMYDVLIP